MGLKNSDTSKNEYGAKCGLCWLPGCSSSSGLSTPPSQNQTAETADYALSNGQFFMAEVPPSVPEGGNSLGRDELSFVSGQLNSGETAAMDQSEKIIYNADTSMETDQFDAAYQAVQGCALQAGGFVEYTQLSMRTRLGGADYKYGELTLKVPAGRYKETLENILALGKVTSRQETQVNATQAYYDTRRRLASKQEEEARLLPLIEQANKVEDIISLEEQLGRARLDIYRYQANLADIDRQAAYSTIAVRLTEVEKLAVRLVSSGLGGRMAAAFTGSTGNVVSLAQNAVVRAAEVSVPVGILAVLAALGYGAFRLGRRQPTGKGAGKDRRDDG